MAFTYDLATTTGQMRLILKDTDSANPIFQDEEYAAFYALEGDVRRGAALGLETIAGDMGSIGILSAGGTSVNGAFAANSLLRRAEALRAQADVADAESGALFGWAEIVATDFQARQRIDNQTLRELA